MRLKFGTCVFDPATHELLRDGEAVALSPKAFQLLETLLAHRPRALSKPELHGAIWPDTFVSDSSLKRLVSELRLAVGDPAREPVLLRTVHRFGYAWSGEVIELDSASEHSRCWLMQGRQVVPLRIGDNLIGRDPEAVLAIDSTKVSRRHSCIRVTPQGATLEDLGSKNGTWVDGVRLVEPTPLHDGVQITVGPVVMTFRESPHGLTTETEISALGEP